jgi:hypothetical protein
MVDWAAVKRWVLAAAGALLALQLGAFGVVADASTPDRSWLGIKRILIIAEVAQVTGKVEPDITADILCNRLQQAASAGSPIPVTCARMGDPRLDDGDTAVLVLQAAVRNLPRSERVLVYTIRRQSTGGLEPAPVYFGSIPQAVVLPAQANFGPLESAFRQSLGEILPWLRKPELKFAPLPKRGE